MLPLATVISLAATCAPQVAPETLAAGARVESGFSTLQIYDNSARRSYEPGTKDEAIALAKELAGHGHSIDLGLAQINSRNIQSPWGSGWLHISLEETFDECANLRAAAEELTLWSRYNTGNPERGLKNGYVSRIVSAYVTNRKGEAASPPGIPPGEPSLPSSLGVQPQPHEWDLFPDRDDALEPVETHSADASPSRPDTLTLNNEHEAPGTLIVQAVPEAQDNQPN
jgi:type IV secretion system protein VirB1